MDDARFRELLEEATLDCYGEEEEFTGVLSTLDDNLHYPLRATLAGVPVVVQGLDDRRSSLRRGIVAEVERDGQREYVGLAELTFVDLDPDSAEWLEMYNRWMDW